MEEPLINAVSLASMGVTGLMAITSYVGAVILYKKFSTSNIDKWVMFWLIWDLLVHFLIVSITLE